MKPLPLNAELCALAQRVIWFETPERALAGGPRFLAYVMTYGSPEDVVTVRRYIGRQGFAEALESVPPGILDERSWAYWNAMAGRYPAPPMPQRKFG